MRNRTVTGQWNKQGTAVKLGTQNQAAAARQARDIYLFLRANGMPETVARFKAKPQEEIKVSTLGEYIEAVEAQCPLTPETLYKLRSQSAADRR